MSKRKVINHLNRLYGINIQVDVPIKVVRDKHNLSYGAFCWIVTEGEYAHKLGSFLTMKELASLIEKDNLLIVKTNNSYLEVVDSAAHKYYTKPENRRFIYNPNKVDMDWFFT